MNEPQGLQLIELSMVARLSFTESMIPNINPDLQNKKKTHEKNPQIQRSYITSVLGRNPLFTLLSICPRTQPHELSR